MKIIQCNSYKFKIYNFESIYSLGPTPPKINTYLPHIAELWPYLGKNYVSFNFTYLHANTYKSKQYTSLYTSLYKFLPPVIIAMFVDYPPIRECKYLGRGLRPYVSIFFHLNKFPDIVPKYVVSVHS